MKSLIILLAFLVSASLLYAAKPIVEVGNILPQEQLEYFEDSDELFAMKVLEYYQTALLLRAQLEMMGIKPVLDVIQPSIEELEDLEIEVIARYYLIAKRLENQIIQAPETDRASMQREIEALQTAINDTVTYFLRQRRELSGKVQVRTVELLNECDSVVSAKMKYLEDQFFNNCYDATPVISVSGLASYIFPNGSDDLENDISLGVNLRINVGKLLGEWDGLGVWYEYSKPRFTTRSIIGRDTLSEIWNSHLHAVGGSVQFELHKSAKYKDGINLSAGYFWCESDIYNKSFNSYFNWSGVKFSLEYLAAVPSCRYPFDLFLRLDMYHSLDSERRFHTGNPGVSPIQLNETVPALSLGLRYNFFRSF